MTFSVEVEPLRISLPDRAVEGAVYSFAPSMVTKPRDLTISWPWVEVAYWMKSAAIPLASPLEAMMKGRDTL